MEDIGIYLNFGNLQPPTEKDIQPKKISADSAKNKRWALDHWALYVAFALEQTTGPLGQKISFWSSRRSYKRFDKDFAELLFQTFEGDNFYSQAEKKNKVEELAKRTKSKFNTLKRSFFRSIKLKYYDFSFLMYNEALKLVREGETIFLDRLVAAMNTWILSYEGPVNDLSEDLQLGLRFSLEQPSEFSKI